MRKLALLLHSSADGAEPAQNVASQLTRWCACVRLCCLVSLLVGRSAPALAADALDIPASCGSQAELEREIATLRAGTTEHGPRADVRLSRDGDTFVLDVQLPDAPRTLRDTDCRALFRAAIIIAALGHETSADAILNSSAAVDPSPQTSESGALALADPSQPSPPNHTRPGRVTSVKDKKDPAPPAPTPLRAHALAHASLAYGAVPAWSAALGAGLDIERGRWGGQLLFNYLTPRTQHTSGDGVRVDGLSASLSLEVGLVRWLKANLGADIFFLRGRGLSVLQPRTDWAVQPTLHAGLRALLFERGRFGLELGARALWAPQPSSFNVSGRGSVYTAERFGFQTGFGLRVQFL